MPLLVELFSGTGSIGRAFRQKGWDVFAVDLNPKAAADLHIDVLELTPAMLPAHIDAIWASPPCTHYSRARTKAKTPRDLIGSDKLVQKVLNLVAHYGVAFFMENPHSGLLKGRWYKESPCKWWIIVGMERPTARERQFGQTPRGNLQGLGAIATVQAATA